jgi:hypothetical protein
MRLCIDNTRPGNEAIQLSAATLFARGVEHTIAAHRLLKNGDLLSAYTVVRANLETGFCLGALSERPAVAFNIMKHSYLKEEKKSLHNLLQNGHESFSNGARIQDAVDEINDELVEFEGIGSGVFDLARIAKSVYIVYRFLSPYAHPDSMICAARTQFGPYDGGPTVRVNYKDVITSEHFVINAAVGFDCLKFAARLLPLQIDVDLEALNDDIDSAIGPHLTEIDKDGA